MTAIIILAAGSSSRLGRPKQNLVYRGATLLQRIIKTALDTTCRPVIVVLGGNADLIKPTIQNLPVTVVYNEAWQNGMSSSIKAGVVQVQREGVDSVIFILCDQPFIDADLLMKLISADTFEGIAACSYNDTIGTPAFFGSKYFPELLELKGNEGAKHLLLRYKEDARIIPFPLGNVDIDTMDDFNKLNNR